MREQWFLSPKKKLKHVRKKKREKCRTQNADAIIPIQTAPMVDTYQWITLVLANQYVKIEWEREKVQRSGFNKSNNLSEREGKREREREREEKKAS